MFRVDICVGKGNDFGVVEVRWKTRRKIQKTVDIAFGGEWIPTRALCLIKRPDGLWFMVSD